MASQRGIQLMENKLYRGYEPASGVSACAHTSNLILSFPFVSTREGGWEGGVQGWRVIDPRMQRANILNTTESLCKLIGTICVVNKNEGRRELESGTISALF